VYKEKKMLIQPVILDGLLNQQGIPWDWRISAMDGPGERPFGLAFRNDLARRRVRLEIQAI
jgi:hypothetical protein